MISLTHAPQIPHLPLKSLFLNRNCAAHSSGGGFIQPRHRRSKCNRGKCFSADQSQQQPQNPRKQSQRPRKKSPPPDSDRKDGIDPAGFLAKHGITNKAFAQFLRERWVEEFLWLNYQLWSFSRVSLYVLRLVFLRTANWSLEMYWILSTVLDWCGLWFWQV